MTATAFDVVINYCDDVRFTHEHDTAAEATKEYVDLVADGLNEEKQRDADTRHVQLVSLVLIDDRRVCISSTDSGVLPCTHERD